MLTVVTLGVHSPQKEMHKFNPAQDSCSLQSSLAVFYTSVGLSHIYTAPTHNTTHAALANSGVYFALLIN